MELICNRNDLIEAINNIHRFTVNKTTLNILEGFHFECTDNKVIFFANNLETAIKYEMEAKVNVEGKCVVNSKIFSDIIHKLREDIVRIRLVEDQKLNISCGNTNITIGTLDADQYPLVDVNIGEKVCSIATDQLANLVQGVLFGVNTTQLRIKKGVRFIFKDNQLTATTFDGSRVCIRKEYLDVEKEVSLTVEDKSIKEILQILKKEAAIITVYYLEKQVIFSINNITIMTRLIDDKGIDYTRLYYNDNLTEVVTDAESLLGVIQTASSLLNNEVRKSPIILDVETDRIQVSCQTVYGNMQDYMLIDVIGPRVRIGLNHRYIIEVLKACSTYKIRLKFRDSSTHIIISPIDTDEFCYIIAPVVIPPR